MARLIKTTGDIVDVEPAQGPAFSLAELQAFVGGYIEAIRGSHEFGPSLDWWMILNEDGKRLELPINVWATLILHTLGGASDDYVVGDVLLATGRECGNEPDEDEAAL